MKLVLLRHGESEWNRRNLFAGWTDVDLTALGREEAREAGSLLRQSGLSFDLCYTSYLKRAIHTLNFVLEQLDREWLPVYKTWKLNGRHYGALQGRNKAETARLYGEDRVKLWRRSFDVRPPACIEGRGILESVVPYWNITGCEIPCGESLRDETERVFSYFTSVIRKEMKAGKRILIVAHGDTIRAFVKMFDNLSDQAVMELEIPTGIPLVYEFDEQGNTERKSYLGDPELVQARINRLSDQGTRHVDEQNGG